MLRSAFIAGLALTVLAGTAQADVYKYTDDNGNTQYTDKPAKLPAQRLSVQSRRTDTVELSRRAQEDQKQTEALNKPAQTPQQQTAQKAANELTAQDKAERCTKARARYDSFMNSQRLYKQNDKGEREYLSDAELDAARLNAKQSMDEFCQ
jgi:hypothetical protein